MSENQRRAEDVLTLRDVMLRSFLAIGLIGAALIMLVVVQAT